MLRQLFTCTENAGTFCHDLNPKLFPGQVCGILLSIYADLFPVDDKRIPVNSYLTVEFAMNRIIFEKVSKRLCIGQVVECDHFNVFLVQQCPEGQAADASKSINSNFC